jgi:hypothetical protein
MDGIGGSAEIADLLGDADRMFAELERAVNHETSVRLGHRAISLVHWLIHLIGLAREDGWETANIRALLPNAWRIHGDSTYIRHIQEWPRGYAGDFLAINMVVDRDERAEPGTLGGILGRYALGITIAEQHREKLRIQAGMIRETCRRVRGARIVSVACGSARDMEQGQDEIRESGARVTLVDFDQGALDDALGRLHAVRDQLMPVLSDVRRLPRLMRALTEAGGRADLVYAGGLFDYLPEGIVRRVLKPLADDLLAEGGTLMFTNIAPGNPWKAWMETMGNWRLIERTEEEMGALLLHTGLEGQRLERDPSGLAWIARARKAG